MEDGVTCEKDGIHVRRMVLFNGSKVMTEI